ncbi:thiamine phosphate synthase, partial [Rickettsia endosymbiont of Cardiosporidium cionae]|uniref:thiamine phosphate synthase n=1 Tax=Rickettsia endosymbiont of Cardiosporidium cionae TaxID=2777155 RepID=UPI0018951898
MKNIDLSLYLIFQASKINKLQDILSVLAISGVSMFQLREKNITDTEFMKYAIEAKKILDEFNASLIINDNVYITKNINATGLHIGQSDISLTEARNILGNNVIIGLSVNNEDEFPQDISLADYISSHVFPSTTKVNKEYIGLEKLKILRA